jgi:hypothetical protein
MRRSRPQPAPNNRTPKLMSRHCTADEARVQPIFCKRRETGRRTMCHRPARHILIIPSGQPNSQVIRANQFAANRLPQGRNLYVR